jgi:hypothetical protein
MIEIVEKALLRMAHKRPLFHSDHAFSTIRTTLLPCKASRSAFRLYESGLVVKCGQGAGG